MFKIFKKEPEVQEKVLDNLLVSNSYPKEVLEIHHEFEIASEKLLEEANNIINTQPKINESKINILKSLGFNQVKEVQESSEILNKTAMSKKQIEAVRYFQQNYPFNKFITEEQVKTICHKYNLVCGDVSRFKGFVPEKNVKEISNFKIKDKDIIVTGTLWGGNTLGEKISHSISFNLFQKLLSKKLIKGEGGGNLDQDDNWCDGKYVNSNFDYFDRISKATLQICAPVKDMDISGLELKEGYKLEKKFIPDPIVLQPVNGGYLILTMWADESFDPFTEPMLRNDKMLN